MLIRYGYELEFFCPQPVMMVCLLDTHADFTQFVRWQGPFHTSVPLQSEIYRDSFGNDVRRFMAPAGTLRISRDQIFDTDGKVDPVFPDAREVPLNQVPAEYLVYLLGSRYCETDKLSNIAWNLFGHIAPGWPRVQAICDYVNNHLTFGYQFARATRTAYEAYEERVGVCRDFAHLAVTLCRCMNIPTRYANGFPRRWTRRYRHPARSRADGLQRLDGSLSRQDHLDGVDLPWRFASDLVPATMCRASGGSPSAAGVMPPTSLSPPHSGRHFLNLFRVWTDEVSEDVLRERELQPA